MAYGKSGNGAFAAPPTRQLRIIFARGEHVTSFRVRPWMTIGVGLITLALGVLYIAATGYLVLRDEFLAASLARQIEVRQIYEARVADLRRDIDRLTSRNLVSQDAVDAELRRLVERQAALDARQDVIAELSQGARQAHIVPKFAPPTAGVTKSAALQGIRLRGGQDRSGTDDVLARIAAMTRSADRLAERQSAYLDAIAGAIGAKSSRLGAALARAGVPTNDIVDVATTAIGGPFVALDDDPIQDGFRAAAAAAADGIELYSRMANLADSTPLAAPIPKAAVASRFGRRIDPFLRRPAMHSGIDFRAGAGRQVRATADGTVMTAARSGGYGRLIEIDHGNGFSTRFAHLSRISVSRGQVVRAGDVIGKVGSSGRSTGPHLHYEIRRGGKAVDPMPFLAAGKDITNLL